jgi:hypothetical protein
MPLTQRSTAGGRRLCEFACVAIIIVGGIAVACKDTTGPPAPVALAFTVQPSNTTAGTGIASAVAIQDASGKVLTTATNSVTLTLRANPGGGALSGTQTVNAVNGVATFSGLSINKAGSGYTLVATSSRLTSTTSAAFTITPAAAAKLAFTVQPPTVVSGQPIAPATTVAIQDVFDNTVTSATNAVTIALGTNLAGGTLSGTTSVNAVNGIAMFSNWSADKCGVGYTLTVTASGLAGATSTAFSVRGCWSTKAPMPTPRTELAVGVVNGILYAVGGSTNSNWSTVVEAYDPSTNSWTTKAPMPQATMEAVGVVNGILYAVSVVQVPPYIQRTALQAEAYDPSTNTWTTKATTDTTSASYQVGVVNGILYAVGVNLNSGSSRPFGTTAAYDPTTDTWTTKAPIPIPVGGLAVGVVNGILYAVGADPNNSGFGAVQAYDPSTNSWTRRADSPAAASVEAVGVVNGILYGVGRNVVGGVVVGTQPVVQTYDPSRDTWTTSTSVPTPRHGFAIGVVGGVLYVVGGIGDAGGSSVLGTVEASYWP